MSLRHDLLNDIRLNGSLGLFAYYLASGDGLFGSPSIPPALLESALDALSVLSPRLAANPIINISFRGERLTLIKQREPFWTLAAKLPPAAAEKLLASAEAYGPLDPAQAWAALRLSSKRSSALTALALARRARCSSPISVLEFCSDFALAGMAGSPTEQASLRLEALAEICHSHAHLPGSLSFSSLIGSLGHDSLPLNAARSQRRFQLIIPATMSSRGLDAERCAARAHWLLDWFEGCSKIAAFHALPDLEAPLFNTHLASAYASIPSTIGPHAFPIGAPSLLDALNARKFFHALHGDLRSEGLPSRRSSL